ncbi:MULTISPECIES: HXXEE domain-containing protein [unclassified Clostridioides]|uniref:HXXEE domain-containing protein n=1 Tax=Clostridioides sp. ZZV14-6154 TaxID=2811495 RepID=UPI001D126457
MTLLSCIFDNYFIWYGCLFAFTFHFIFPHFNLYIRFKHHVPGVFTSIIFLPICIWLLYITSNMLNYSLFKLSLSCFIGTILLVIIFVSLHKAMKFFEYLLIMYQGENNH